MKGGTEGTFKSLFGYMLCEIVWIHALFYFHKIIIQSNKSKYIFYSNEEPPTLMPLTFGRDILDEGEFAQLLCIVSKGDEPLTISWALKGDKISSEPSLTTASLGTRTSMLTIGSVGYRHSGTYTCTAKNGAGATSETAELKVNGKLL